MIGISGWGGETTHSLLRAGRGDCCANWNEEEITLVIKMAREVQEERVTTSISMQMSLWRPRTVWIDFGRGGGCLSSCWVLYRLPRGGGTLGIWAKTFHAFFLGPCAISSSSMGSGCHRSLLMPQLCRARLHCYHQRKCSLKCTAAIKGQNNEREQGEENWK